MKLGDKLLDIQKELKSVEKDKLGGFGTFKYKYTSGDVILARVRELMDERSLLLIPSVTSVEASRQDYTTGRGIKKSEVLFVVMMKMTWMCIESGDTLEVSWAGSGQNDFDKGFGSALTYAERYFLLKFFHIPTNEDDPDSKINTDYQHQQQQPPPQQTQHQQPQQPTKPTKPKLGNAEFDKFVARMNKGEDLYAQIDNYYSLTIAQDKVLKNIRNGK